MADLIRDWLLDPAALLFLLSLMTIIVCVKAQHQWGAFTFARWKYVFIFLWLAFFMLCSAPVLVNPLLATLEDQYPASSECEAGSHLVVLGGGVDSRIQSDIEFEHMSQSTISRATAAVRIAADEPQLRIVIAGGALIDISEADVIARYMIALGTSQSRILRDGLSRNTRENALNVASLLASETLEGQVRLVTSALHMPRALRTFHKVLNQQGIAICPISVGREALIDVPVWAWMPQTSALAKFDKLLHEIAALAIYRLRGWI